MRLIRELKLISTPNPDGPYPAYSSLEPLSTETPINNGPSIKEMTDKELMSFLRRLQNETEMTRVISNIKTMNAPITESEGGTSPNTKSYEGIDLDIPVKDLYHVGVMGMRWGVRKERSGGKFTKTSEKKTKPPLTDAQDVKRLTSLKTSQLSNTDIKRITERLQLERSYKSLKPNNYTKGMNVVKGITTAGTTVASLYALSATPLGQAIITAIKKRTAKVAATGP